METGFVRSRALRRSGPSLLTFLLLVSLFLLSGCASGATPPGPGNDTGISATNTPVVEPPTSTTVAANIALGEQPCPAAVSNVSRWSAFVTPAANSAVARINCAHLRGTSSLQALVLVGYEGTGHIVDVYVFDTIESATPTQLLKLTGLSKGDAKISAYSTVMTSEADLDSRLNKDQPGAAQRADLFREFKWADTASKFVPVAFPGIYPDLTRWQAEEDQQQLSTGVDPWKRDAQEVAKHFGESMLDWTGTTTSIASGAGASDVSAIVMLKSSHPGNPQVRTHLSRLNGSTDNLWVITRVDADNTAITSPEDGSRVSSPVDVTGKGTAFEGVVGELVVYDHLYDKISTTNATLTSANGNGNAAYSAQVKYQVSFKSGEQEGIVAHYTRSNADGSIASVAMVKVLLG
jgi:hypothetical protein